MENKHCFFRENVRVSQQLPFKYTWVNKNRHGNGPFEDVFLVEDGDFPLPC